MRLALSGLGAMLAIASATFVGAAPDPLGDEARQAGKPLIADFGMTRCLQCIEQAKTMDELKIAVGDRLLVSFVHVGEEPALAEVYKVLLIPTLVFFDDQGNEVFRNVGAMQKEPLLAKARELRLLD